MRCRFCLTMLVLSFAPKVWAGCSSTCRPDGVAASGAKYRICVPDPGCWNGDLVVYAHGYVPPDQPLQIPESQLTFSDGSTLPSLVNQLGFAFAVTSYRTNGLAIRQGVEDLRDLVTIFDNTSPVRPKKVFLVGVSEGSLSTVLSLEQSPGAYSAAVAACGPIGDFQSEINYIGDFRVVFDYFFPGIIPGSAVSIPDEVIRDWTSVYAPRVSAALQSKPIETFELLNVTKASIDIFNSASVAATVLELLQYSVTATNDIVAKLGGQPFGNQNRVYSGSFDDATLNKKVGRYHEDWPAVSEIASHYTTTGKIAQPLITIHTTADPLIPYSQEQLYDSKTMAMGTESLHSNIPVFRYGHCSFQTTDLLFAFGSMLLLDAFQP